MNSIFPRTCKFPTSSAGIWTTLGTFCGTRAWTTLWLAGAPPGSAGVSRHRADPDPQRVVKAGRVVELAMSLGPEIAEVPDVTGLPEREARLILTQQGFTLGTWKRSSGST